MAFNRRDFMSTTGAIVGATLSGLSLAQSKALRDGHAPITKQELDALARQGLDGQLTCVRTLESNDGPYYYETSPKRRSIAEGHRGVRLRLGIIVASAPLGGPCAPLGGAIVDVWLADANGQYSNVGSELQAQNTIGQTFLRGHQITDNQGYVEFDAIVPGWELVAVPEPISVVLRATHIHVKVFHEHKVVTTQLYFPDEFLDSLYASTDPYKAHRSMTAPGLTRRYDRIRNDQDNIFKFDESRPMNIEREKDGVFARATIGLTSLGTRGFAPLFR